MLSLTCLLVLSWSVACDSRDFDLHDREKHEKRSPAEKKRDRLSKYDHLLETVRQNKAHVPDLEEQIAALKAREEAIFLAEDLLPPQPPRLAFASEDEEEEDPLSSLLAEGEPRFNQIRDNPKAREDMVRKSRERLERLKNLDPEERIEEMRRERDERVKTSPSEEDKDERKRLWRTRSSDRKRKSGLEHLTPEERHAKLLEHQKLMDEHRVRMDEWREQHHAHKEERRAVMNAYRDLLHQTREAVFDSRPL